MTSKANPYTMFAQDEDKVQNGIRLNYEDVFYITVGRADETNPKYVEAVTEKLRPYRRAIQTGTIKESALLKMSKEATIEGVVLGWGSKEFGDGFIPGKDGKKIEFSVENAIKLFADLPQLAKDVLEQANNFALFKAEGVEADAKN